MPNKHEKITVQDHQILLCLIRGHSTLETSVVMGVTRETIDRRLKWMRNFLDCRTNFQLIALEITFLMEHESMMLPEVSKSMQAVAGK